MGQKLEGQTPLSQGHRPRSMAPNRATDTKTICGRTGKRKAPHSPSQSEKPYGNQPIWGGEANGGAQRGPPRAAPVWVKRRKEEPGKKELGNRKASGGGWPGNIAVAT